MTAGTMIKWLFCFKKPLVEQLSYIPVLVKDKPVLFVAWQVKYARSVQFKPLNCRYFTVQNAVMLALPHQLQVVTLKASNCWRKTIIHLPLQAVQLNEAAVAQLIDGFRPLNKTDIHTPLVAHIKSRIIATPYSIQQHSNSIKNIDRFKVAVQPFTVNIQPFNYQ